MTKNRIEDYALVGDCETAALVGIDGSIDWLCWPRFDSDACFAAILGTPAHGRWLLAPTEPITARRRRYRGDSLILETMMETAAGAVRIVDFMPPRGSASDLCRLVVGERGQVKMGMELVLRFGYGANVPWVTRDDDLRLRLISGPDMAILRPPIKTHGEAQTTIADFTVEAGQTYPFVLTYSASHLAPPAAIDPQAALADTEEFWQQWSCCYRQRMRGSAVAPATQDLMMRSLIVLKAMTYAPTGGMVAAPTCALPEEIGGGRNWDYRYCWIRDATLTLLALMNAGYFDEAKAWRDWLLRAAAGNPEQTQIMYGLSGERRLLEWEADWLPGYRQSQPVRIGNAAHTQLQLDVYGELCDALHQARSGGLPESRPAWAMQCVMLDHLETIWQKPDKGIWESRGPPRHFTYSKVMCWVAFDRTIKSAEQFGLEGPIERWRASRDAIHQEVCAKAWNEKRGSFVAAYGADELDASLLLLPSVGFLPACDPRIIATVEAVEQRLLVDGFVFRHDAEWRDDIARNEGAFLACSFWLVDALLMIGRRDDAEDLLLRLFGVANDVGLLAEEFDVNRRCQAGNFPQAFSHVALVNSCHNLWHQDKPVEQRAGAPAEGEPAPSG